MTSLDVDNLPGVNSEFLRTITTSIDPRTLTSISLTHATRISSGTVATLVRKMPNVTHLNFKGCVNLNNATFPEKVVQKLQKLSYLNISYTQITGKAIALVYKHCPELATLKVSGCKYIVDSHTHVANIFPHSSEMLRSFKVRMCGLTQNTLKEILELFPNLETLDCSSTNIQRIRPFFSSEHESQLRKLNLSNCPDLDLTRPMDLDILYACNPNLEHIYLTDARTHLPCTFLANLKTLFMPGLHGARTYFTDIVLHGHNLTYIDLSRTDLNLNSHTRPLAINVPNLRTLSLIETRIDDSAAEVISQMHTLRSLFLRGTAISAEGMRTIVFGCPWLEEVDLASCRRIGVLERRTLFSSLRGEFWECLAEAKGKGSAVVGENGKIYQVKRVYSGEEERDALVVVENNDVY